MVIVSAAGYSQKLSKAEKEAKAKEQFDKALSAIESKAFVIIPDTYGDGSTNDDDANFISYEGEFFFLQGMIICGNKFTNKTTVTEYKQEIDKRGTLRITMRVVGSAITAKIEISMRKNGNYADVVVTPTKGETKMFSGEVTLLKDSKYRKRANIV